MRRWAKYVDYYIYEEKRLWNETHRSSTHHFLSHIDSLSTSGAHFWPSKLWWAALTIWWCSICSNDVVIVVIDAAAIQFRGDKSLSHGWNVSCCGGTITSIHWQNSCSSSESITLRSEKFPIAWSTVNISIMFCQVITVKSPVAGFVGCWFFTPKEVCMWICHYYFEEKRIWSHTYHRRNTSHERISRWQFFPHWSKQSYYTDHRFQASLSSDDHFFLFKRMRHASLELPIDAIYIFSDVYILLISEISFVNILTGYDERWLIWSRHKLFERNSDEEWVRGGKTCCRIWRKNRFIAQKGAKEMFFFHVSLSL